MLQPFCDDTKGKSLNPGHGRLLCLPVRQDAGQLDNLCKPAAVILSFGFDLECDQVLMTSRVTSVRRWPRLFDCQNPPNA
jgi:hypothetical protein